MNLEESDIFMLGVSHRTAALEAREQLLQAGTGLEKFCQEAMALPDIEEMVVLSTCNRIEFYGVGKEASSGERLARRFCLQSGLEYETEFKEISQLLYGKPVIEHLIRVSAGLDSQLLGETEIFGQVKAAYKHAGEHGYTGQVLNRIFQKVFQATKHIRSHTGVSLGHVSVAGVSVDLACRIFGKLENVRVLLLGAGEVAEKVSRAFLSRNAKALAVANRTAEHALRLASELDVKVLPWDRVAEHLWEYSIIVGSTASPDTVVSRGMVEAAMKKRPAEPLFLIDLAMPRDFDASAADLENVFLYNLDDIAGIASENLHEREDAVSRGEKIAAEKAVSIWKMIQSRAEKKVETGEEKQNF